MGVVGGSLTWGVLDAAGLSAILATYASALVVIKVFGGFYLLWLAYKAFRAAASPQISEISRGGTGPAVDMGVRDGAVTSSHDEPEIGVDMDRSRSLGLTPDAPLWVAAAIVTGTIILSAVINLSPQCAGLFNFDDDRFYTPLGGASQTGHSFAIAGLRMLTDRN